VRAETGDSPACPRPSAASEKKIPGGLTFLTLRPPDHGRARRGLIARVGAADMGAAVAGLGVRRSHDGLAMRGIIVRAGNALDDRALDRWIGRAGSYVALTPPGRSQRGRCRCASCHEDRLAAL
jgi:hypothetical protein